jgi:hypothetical protein
MTMDELEVLGKECLAQYKSKLDVRGLRPFSFSATKISKRLDVYLEGTQPESIRPAICELLNGLAGIGAFVMSEPQYAKAPGCIELGNSAEGNLRLTFMYGWSAADSNSYLWIHCWHYPAPALSYS